MYFACSSSSGTALTSRADGDTAASLIDGQPHSPNTIGLPVACAIAFIFACASFRRAIISSTESSFPRSSRVRAGQ